MKKIAGLVLLLTGITAYAAEVYTWTDERGRTHYSDKPVPQAKKIEVKLPGDSSTPKPAGEDDAGMRQRECQNKKDQLQNYERAEKIVERDSLGNDREFNPEQRKQLIARTRQQMDEACRASSSSTQNETTTESPSARVEAIPPEERAK